MPIYQTTCWWLLYISYYIHCTTRRESRLTFGVNFAYRALILTRSCQMLFVIGRSLTNLEKVRLVLSLEPRGIFWQNLHTDIAQGIVKCHFLLVEALLRSNKKKKKKKETDPYSWTVRYWPYLAQGLPDTILYRSRLCRSRVVHFWISWFEVLL